LGADPDLMEGACLAHDIGHPPFGHNGEDALNAVSESCGGFEGNAQSFRLLVRLEAKTVDQTGNSVGLNLTRASLDAATKYPWPRAINSRKFGVYDDDLKIFNWVRLGAPEGMKSMEAQIMDWSDDVAYSVHDLEDSLVTGQVKLEHLAEDLPAIFEVAKNSAMEDMTEVEAHQALKDLQSLSCWPTNYDGSHRHLARLKDLASQLVGRFALAAEKATREEFGDGDLTRYCASLIVPREQRIEVAILKSIATFYVINASSSVERYADQQIVIKELVEMVLAGAPATLESFFQEDWRQATNDSQKLRVVIDQVASLTDPGAYTLHTKLNSLR
jgi:dGTPase